MTEEQQQADINAIQHLYFELLRRVRYNLLDGERVVGDLDEEMRFAHLDDEHDRVLFVWWD